MKPRAICKPTAIAGKQYCDTRISVVVGEISKHTGLQELVDTFFPAMQRSALQETDFHSFVLKTIPHVAKLGRCRAYRYGSMGRAAGACQSEQVSKVNAYQRPCGLAFSVRSSFLGADENVRVVPISDNRTS